MYKSISDPCKYSNNNGTLFCDTSFTIRSTGEACAEWDQNTKQPVAYDAETCCALATGSAYRCKTQEECGGVQVGTDEDGCPIYEQTKKLWTCTNPSAYPPTIGCEGCGRWCTSTCSGCAEACSANGCFTYTDKVTCGGQVQNCDPNTYFTGNGITWDKFKNYCYGIFPFTDFPYIHKSSSIILGESQIDESNIKISGSDKICYEAKEKDIDKNLQLKIILTKDSADKIITNLCSGIECPASKCENGVYFSGGTCLNGECIFEDRIYDSPECKTSLWERFIQWIKKLFS